MKKLIIPVLLFIMSSTFGQGTFSKILDADKKVGKFTFRIDTLNMNKDTAFVAVNGFYNDTVAFVYHLYNLQGAFTFHGILTSWYKNGIKKSKGNYTYGNKNNDWKYWNKNGIEINEVEYKQQKKE